MIGKLMLGAALAPGVALAQAPVVFESGHSPSETKGWVCGPERWIGEPATQDGVFEGTLAMECRIEVQADEANLDRVRAEMVETLLLTRQVHAGPDAMTESGLPGVKFDVSVAIRDGRDEVNIREDAVIATDGRRHLVYQTDSKMISATGMASYLKKVAFRSDVMSVDRGYEVRLWNRIAIRRPWYALSLMFTPIAKGKVLEKFEKVRAELLPRIAASLNRGAGELRK